MEKLEKTLVWVLLVVVLGIFGTIGYFYLAGSEEAPPIPEATQLTEETLPTETQEVPETTAAPGPIRVACLGDSITYGHGISSRSENSYPAKLGALLGGDYLVENFGVPGATAQDAGDQPIRKEQSYEDCLAFEGDIVILMLGTNDSKPDNWAGEKPFREALLALLTELTAGENPPEIWLCTPASAFYKWGKWGSATSFDIQPEVVAEIAATVREVAETEGYPLIDIHGLTAENQHWFKTDGVHPDKVGATAIAQAVYGALTEAQS